MNREHFIKDLLLSYHYSLLTIIITIIPFHLIPFFIVLDSHLTWFYCISLYCINNSQTCIWVFHQSARSPAGFLLFYELLFTLTEPLETQDPPMHLQPFYSIGDLRGLSENHYEEGVFLFCFLFLLHFNCILVFLMGWFSETFQRDLNQLWSSM